MRLCALEDFGKTDWNQDDQRFEISIDPAWGWSLVRETLCHEWAHCVVWDVPGPDHGPLWGVAYAQAYTAVIGS